MDPYENKSTVDEIRKRFDNDVERFSNLETGQAAISDAPLMMELITRAAVSVCPDAGSVLDIGCGAGNNTLKLLELINPLDCDLVDLSLPMLSRAEERIQKVNTGTVRTHQGDFRTLPLQKEGYDIIIAAAVLHHLRDNGDWEQTFKKIFDICAAGGSVWITDVVIHDDPEVHRMMWERYGDDLAAFGGEEYRDTIFNYIEIEDTPRSTLYQTDLLKKAGFSRVEILHKTSCFAAFGAVKD